MKELKLCPFCGGNAAIDFDKSDDTYSWWAGCPDPECCGCHDSYSQSESEAKAKWNTRVAN